VWEVDGTPILGPAPAPPPGHSDRIEDERRRHERPEPALLAVRAVPGFIAVEHRLLGQRPLEFLARPGDGGTRFFPGFLGAPHADRNLERPFEQPLHDESRQATHDRQVRNQGGQLRSELPLDLVGQGHLRGLAARGTDDWRTLYSVMCASIGGNSVT